MERGLWRFAAGAGLLLAASSAGAQFDASPPPLPQDLYDIGAVVCLKVANDGAVEDAYVLVSTGDDDADQDLVDYIKLVHWPEAEKGEKLRDVWFPVPIATGAAQPPDPPPSCGPPPVGPQDVV